MNKTIPVLEVFGPTIQGEGLVIGQKTMFVRTAGCDYSCSWCDSAFTWDGSAKDEIRLLTAPEIYQELVDLTGTSIGHVTLSGGNPALLKNLEELISLLHERGIKVALETQGSRWQDWFYKIDDMTLSPKPPSSGMETNWDQLDEIILKLRNTNQSLCLKVVVFDEKDLVYAKHVHQRYEDIPFVLQPGNRNLNMVDNEHLLQHQLSGYQWLVDRAMEDKDLIHARVLPQLHTWLWGNKRGV